MSKSLGEKLAEMECRFEEIEGKIVDPQIISQGPLYATLIRDHGRLAKLVQPFREWKSARDQFREARAILDDPDADSELKELAQLELPEIEQNLTQLRDRVKRAAIQDETAPDRNAIIEIRAGTGGEEAALFAADLYRMYTHYAEAVGWKISQLDARTTDLGGLKEITASVEGPGAYPKLRFESGGHRVQRVPTTETQGRIHTSLVTVAVLPEAEEVDVQINTEDIEMSFFRASGPGGQKVNKTSSAVRLIHLPTGIEASCQESPSQHKNRAQAMRVLRARIFERVAAEKQAARDEERRSKIGSGDRNARIRTYNFPQNRVTDHRIGFTLHDLPAILDGKVGQLIEALLKHEIAEREKGLELE